jgi:hypothetical protein
MSLWLGEAPHRPAFRDDKERREAWLHHRDELLARFGARGRRPAGWWDYEAPIKYPGHDYESAALYEAGLLTEAEAAELVRHWREEFDRAQEPGFAHCIGHRRRGDTFASFLTGIAAQRAHYKWAGIPRALVRQWTTALNRPPRRRELDVRPRSDS